MQKTLVIAAIAFVNTLTNAQEKSPIKLFSDKKLSTITYSMNHPLHSWTGESNDITSLILIDENKTEIKQVAVSVKISTFDSKNANRDSHTMEATEAIKYPTISFASTLIKQDGNKLTVTGTLSFHGVSQVITFEAEKNLVNNKIEITGGFVLKMTQFNIEPPSMMGMASDDDFKISFSVLY